MDNKEMQIEELAKAIKKASKPKVENKGGCTTTIFPSYKHISEKLYNAGYRKADEVEKEIVKAILYDFDNHCPNSSIGRSLWMNRIRNEYGVEVEE